MELASLVRRAGRLVYARTVPFPYRVAFRQALFSRRAAAAYRSTTRLLATATKWTPERWTEYQILELHSLMRWATETVPFWRRWRRTSGCAVEELRSLAELRALPTMTKADLQERLAEYTSDAVPPTRRAYATTGGSTGTPVAFLEEVATMVAREHAYLDHVRSQFGCSEREPHVVLGGAFVGDPERARLWDSNPIWSELAVSSYHLHEPHVGAMWERMVQFRPSYLEGYSSALTLLAQHAATAGPRTSSLKMVFARSENLYGHQRRIITSAFGVPVANWYGHAEKAVFAAECPAFAGYHVFPSYGIVELLRPDGSGVSQPGEVGEIVATGLNNRATVFIRYRTSDLASWAESSPCPCGRSTPRLARIDGRLQELIMTATGRLISMAAINFHDEIFDNVRQFQFYQDTPGAVILRLVAAPGFGPSNLDRIRR